MSAKNLIFKKAEELGKIAHKYTYWSHSFEELAKYVLLIEIKSRLEEHEGNFYAQPRIAELKNQLKELEQCPIN